MTARVKLPALPVEGTDTSAAIVTLLGTMPREHQVALIETLQPKAVLLRWLEPPDAARLFEVIEGWDPDSRGLIENRLVPP